MTPHLTTKLNTTIHDIVLFYFGLQTGVRAYVCMYVYIWYVYTHNQRVTDIFFNGLSPYILIYALY